MNKMFNGDIIQLYYFNNFKYDTLTKEQRLCLYSLKNKVLNDLPLIGSFCDYKCTMEDIIIEEEIIYFKFIFEVEIIKQQEGRPIKFISPLVVESKNFLSKGISAIICNEEIKYEKILSIINAIPSFVNLKLNSGFQFKYTPPSFKEINLQEDKLIYIKAFFENNLFIVKDDTITKFALLKSNEFDQDTILLNSLSTKGKCKVIEYYFKSKEGKKSLSINCNGSIYSSYPIEENTFKDIVNLIYILYKIPRIEEFLKPIDSIMEEYLSFIHSEATVDARVRLTSLLLGDIKSMIKEIIKNEVVGSVYITIVLNILIRLSQREKIETDYCLRVDFTEYWALLDFLKLYFKKKFAANLEEQRVIEIICEISHLIQLSQGDEERLISLYRR
ncbi:MAG: hypothetical protein H7Y18_16200 [Clostridiaceae bacterium]|nr:hypothetical protein [Clostridiaceae bacterium]